MPIFAFEAVNSAARDLRERLPPTLHEKPARNSEYKADLVEAVRSKQKAQMAVPLRLFERSHLIT